MKVANIDITPALSLDPELLFHGAEGEAIFRTVLGQSTLGQARHFGTFRLYRASEILKDIRGVADFFFRATNGGKDKVSLLGGYAFLDGERFLFGAECAYAFHHEWEKAFKSIEMTSPVDVVIDERQYKLIKGEGNIAIYRGTNEFVAPLTEFLNRAADAVNENQRFRLALASELRRRFAQAECDLAIQLE